MDEEGDDFLCEQLAAECLRAEAQEIAQAASRLLIGRHPEIAQRYHPTPHEKWREAIAARVRDLADAMSVAAPKLFSSQVAWSKAAFVSRGVPVEDLRVSLLVMREVLHTHVPEDDREMVQDYIDQALEALEAAPDAPPPVMSMKSPHGELAARYLLSILEGDRHRACRMLMEAAQKLKLGDIYRHVITPVMHELGRMWHVGEVTVAEEHFATATTLMAMSQIVGVIPRKPDVGKTLLAACIQGNSHEIGMRMVADTFDLEGWRVVYLGQNVPSEDLVIAVRDFRADLVALSATLNSQLQTLGDAIAAIRGAEGPQPRVIVGGLALDLALGWKHLGADGYANSPEAALALGASLCGVAAS